MAALAEERGARPRARLLRAALLGAAAGVLAALLAAELLLRAFPGLLPQAYREEFPLRGVEFLRPGVLARTDVGALPVPLVPLSWDGPPPADLVDYGVAPADAGGPQGPDGRRFPRVVTPADARGLPNPAALERAGVVCVGDSFVLSASSTDPPGLVPLLAERLGTSAYSLGVAGIGPHQEAQLLRDVGLPLAPELVLWFFFGGNDLSDAKLVEERRARGWRTHADLPDYRPPPRLRLAGLLGWLAREPAANAEADAREPLPPFRLGEAGEPTWLHPAHLVRCTLARGDWEAHAAWDATLELLRAARAAARAHRAHFVLVYLPSKAQALLPALADQAELLHRTLAFDLDAPPSLAPEAARDRLLAHRGGLEQALGAFCAQEGIAFFSATPALERQAREGVAGFLAADTHWAPAGEARVLAELIAFLAREAPAGE